MNARTGNHFLDALSPAVAKRLLEKAKLVELPLGIKICEPEKQPQSAWLLTKGIASLTFTSERGNTIELSTIGKEGIVEAFAVLGNQRPVGECAMQLGGTGYVLPMQILRSEFEQTVELRRLLLQFVEQQIYQTYQIVACNRLHDASSRFARWLLMVQDRIEGDVLHMTQEFLGNMLGTRRTTVVTVAGGLQRQGAIEYTRGVIRITDRALLERQACECYPLIKRRFDALYRDRRH